MRIEMLLKLFICIVDAQLLKAILVKALEAKNIQNSQLMDSFRATSPFSLHFCLNIGIDFTNNPIEELTIDSFSTRVARRDSLVFLERSHDNFSTNLRDFRLQSCEKFS
jgi:hypothetical protein